MRLNVEELSHEAWKRVRSEEWREGKNVDLHPLWCQAFASLIVERCAVECDKLFDERAAGGFPREASSARTLSIRIRNLLEDK